MDIASLQREVSRIQESVRPHDTMPEDHLEKLFDVFRQIDAAIGECKTEEAAADDAAENLIDAQSVVLRLAATMPARTSRDILYKLALWRWDAADVGQHAEGMNRADAIAYSAFLDLVAMLGARDVLKDFDKAS